MIMIYVENMSGDIVRAVTWNGPKEDGISRVTQEVKEKNIPVKKVWAVPLSVKTTA